MPNHGKGGRKPEHDEAKRAPVVLRVTPTLKAQIEASAKESDQSLTKEIEQRLTATFDAEKPERTKDTLQLLNALARDIERAERLTGKRWHEDAKTWAMVREALASGEIERKCPTPVETDRDGYISELRAAMDKAMTAERDEERLLERLGVYVALAREGWPSRTDKAKALEQIADKPEALRELATEALDRLLEAEGEYAELWDRISLERSDLFNDIWEGCREWYADQTRHGIFTKREYRPDLHDVAPNLAASLNRLFRRKSGMTLGDLWASRTVEGQNDAAIPA